MYAQSGNDPTQGAQEITTHDSPVTFSTAVNLVMVPVVVRDSKGHAVGTLHQEDFRLFDKGKLQTITRFSIEKTGTPSAPPETSIETDAGGNPRPNPAGGRTAQPIAQHFLAWLFDDVHLSFSDMVRARAAALRVLTEPLEPGTRVAIYTTSGHVALDFTDDRDRLAQTVNQIRPFPMVVGSKEDCPAIDYYQADRILNLNDAEARLAAEVSYVIRSAPPGGAGGDPAGTVRRSS